MEKNNTLKAKIIEKYGTQGDFAEVLNIHESKVSQVVCGRRPLTPAGQDQWSDLLGTPKEKLFSNNRR